MGSRRHVCEIDAGIGQNFSAASHLLTRKLCVLAGDMTWPGARNAVRSRTRSFAALGGVAQLSAENRSASCDGAPAVQPATRKRWLSRHGQGADAGTGAHSGYGGGDYGACALLLQRLGEIAVESLKVARQDGKRFKIRREAKDQTIDCLLWYDRGRLHSTLDFVRPMQFEQGWLAG